MTLPLSRGSVFRNTLSKEEAWVFPCQPYSMDWATRLGQSLGGVQLLPFLLHGGCQHFLEYQEEESQFLLLPQGPSV